MIRYINIAGVEHPVDYSIMTLAQLARAYKSDITGLAEVFQSFKDEVEYIDAVATIGVVALNAGAKREGTGKEFTKYDLYDALSADMSLANSLVTDLFDSMRGDAVFTTPPTAAEKKKKPSKRG